MLVAGIMITGLVLYIFKPTYEVSLDGEVIGYTKDKSTLQARINEYLQEENGDVAFIQVDNMPEYDLCLLKKSIETNDDEIYEKVISQGTTYYRYYALLDDGEEKYYFKVFEDAESVVDQLKDKDSANKDDLTVIEKYSTFKKNPVTVITARHAAKDRKCAGRAEQAERWAHWRIGADAAEYADIDDSVSDLYEKKVVVRTASSGSGTIAATGMNNSKKVVNIGITLIRPTSGTISSRFGWRSRDNHKGIDIAASYGTPIYAAASGTVTLAKTGYGGGYGNHIIISHGNGVQTLYGHCSSLCVEQGAHVSQGQLIAKMGSTGNSTGNHLHFEVRVNGVAQDPQNYVY